MATRSERAGEPCASLVSMRRMQMEHKIIDTIAQAAKSALAPGFAWKAAQLGERQ